MSELFKNIQPENPESLTEVEQLRAGHKLRQLVDGTLLKFAEHVRVYDGTIIRGERSASLLLEHPDGSILIESRSSKNDVNKKEERIIMEVKNDII